MERTSCPLARKLDAMHDYTSPPERDAMKSKVQPEEHSGGATTQPSLPEPPAVPTGEVEEKPNPQTEIRRLSAALEDIVALAHSSGDHRERVIQMQRRAIAALTGADRKAAIAPARS